jgi:PAS domain S-box-containing protein
MSTIRERATLPRDLASFLRENRDAIVEDWARSARELRSARHLPTEQLLDRVPQLLDDLASSLATGGVPTTAEVHVQERLRSSFALEDLVTELALLRDAAIGAWRRARPPGDPRDEQALHRAIDRVVVRAAARHGEVHDRILHALERISTVALFSDDQTGILRALATTFHQESPAAISVVLFLTDERGQLTPRAQAGPELATRAADIEALCHDAIGARSPRSARLATDRDVLHVHVVPLVADDTPVGAAVLTTEGPSVLSERDRVLFGSMAARATAALHQHALRQAATQSARRLEESEARYRATFEGAGIGIAELTLDGRWLRLNGRYCHLLGYPHDELVRLRWQDVTHPDDVATLEAQLASGELDFTELETRCVRKDGSVMWVRLNLRVVRDANGAPLRLIAAAQDVSNAKRMRERLELLAAASARLVSTLDPQECVEQVAELAVPSLSDWCGVMVERAPGTPELELRAVAHRDPARIAHVWEMQRRHPYRAREGMLEQVRREGRPRLLTEVDERTLRALAYDDEHLAMLRRLGVRSLLLMPLRARERTFGVLLLAHAESERRFESDDVASVQLLAERAAMAIDNAHLHDETRRAVQLRDQILAIVSHDLRNPLSAIDLGSQLLRESAVAGGDAVGTRQAEIIQRNTARMARLIGDLLDVSSIQAGKLAIERRPIDLGALLAEAHEAHDPMARDKGVLFQLDVEVGDARVSGDRDRLLQVLSNLIGNAIKFCHAGEGVTLEARVVDGRARVRVADTGPGIPEQDRAHVFDLYWKGRRGGTGLGLAISKGIVEAHGGRIAVEAPGPRGSVFVFTLPLAAS